MRYELVTRLTHVGHRYTPESLPDRGLRRRVGALARPALRVAAVAALLVATTLGVQLAAITAASGSAVGPAVGWVGVIVATAAAPTLASRLVVTLVGRA